MDSPILGSDGKPFKSAREVMCPECGRGPSQRIPSGGFGETWLVCLCGYEFNRELKCPKVTV